MVNINWEMIGIYSLALIPIIGIWAAYKRNSKTGKVKYEWVGKKLFSIKCKTSIERFKVFLRGKRSYSSTFLILFSLIVIPIYMGFYYGLNFGARVFGVIFLILVIVFIFISSKVTLYDNSIGILKWKSVRRGSMFREVCRDYLDITRVEIIPNGLKIHFNDGDIDEIFGLKREEKNKIMRVFKEKKVRI
jgi:phosphate/sulfate permease